MTRSHPNEAAQLARIGHAGPARSRIARNVTVANAPGWLRRGEVGARIRLEPNFFGWGEDWQRILSIAVEHSDLTGVQRGVIFVLLFEEVAPSPQPPDVVELAARCGVSAPRGAAAIRALVERGWLRVLPADHPLFEFRIPVSGPSLRRDRLAAVPPPADELP